MQFPLPMCNSFVSSSSVPLLQSVTVTVHGGVGTVLLLQNGALRNRFEIEFGPLLPRCYAISLEFRSVRYGRCMYPVKAPRQIQPTESLPTDRHLLTLEPSLAQSRSVSDSRSVCLSASRGVHFHFHSTNYVPSRLQIPLFDFPRFPRFRNLLVPLSSASQWLRVTISELYSKIFEFWKSINI